MKHKSDSNEHEPGCTVVRLQSNTLDLPGMLSAVDNLHQSFMQHHGINTPPSQFVDFIHCHLGDETMFLALAMYGDTPVGYGLAFDVPSHPFIPDWQRSGYITNLFAVANQRGKGIGQTLYDSMGDWFCSRGIESVLLNVDVEQPQAEAFWRKQGFAPYLLRMKLSLETNGTSFRPA